MELTDSNFLEFIWRAIDEGSTPAILLIAYFLWKLDKEVGNYIAIVKAQQDGRDAKLNSIQSDINAMIRKLANMKNGE